MALGLFLTAILFHASPASAGSPDRPAFATVWEKPQGLDGAWKFRPGDSTAWANPGYGDSSWDAALLWAGPEGSEMGPRDSAWYRAEILLPAVPGPGKTLGLLHPPATTEVYYWDGVRIAGPPPRGGLVTGDQAGNMALAMIPPDLSGPGRHVLAIRMSGRIPSFHPNSDRLTLGEAMALELGAFRHMMVMYFLAGVLVFGGVYRFLNYRAAGYGRNTILFSVFVLSCATFIVLQYIGAVVDLDASGLMAVRILVSVSWYFIISMVPDYFIFAETFPYRWLLPVLLVGGLVVAVPMGLQYTGYAPHEWVSIIPAVNHAYLSLSIAASLWVIGWAVWRKQTGSGLALSGIASMAAGVAVSWMFELPWAWAAGVAAHVVFLARAQSRQMAERMAGYREMQLRSARLEIELLKKNIQPHFLLNSLNSIIAWLEEEPKTAARLVNALAEELGTLLRISSRKTISIEEEIHLCRTHLQVMGLRQDKTFTLDCSGLAGGEQVPPMVLHTLVENGLTHGYAGKAKGRFLLRREDQAGGMRLTLFNDGKPREKKEKKGEGTGLRYVRSRLEEAFPGRWNLDSRAVENGWAVTLDIKNENG